jgi:hypothetical protein
VQPRDSVTNGMMGNLISALLLMKISKHIQMDTQWMWWNAIGCAT